MGLGTKTAVGAFAALVLLSAGAALERYPPRAEASGNTDDVETRSVGPGQFRLMAEGDSCTIFKGPPLGSGLNDLVIPAECDSLMPDLSAMRFWKEDGDGSVAFSPDGTEGLVLFSVADGVAYESYKPARPLLILTEN